MPRIYLKATQDLKKNPDAQTKENDCCKMCGRKTQQIKDISSGACELDP